MRQVVRTDKAPQPVGPYSQAIVHKGVVYVAGQGPTNVETGETPDSPGEQTRQVLKNIQAILEAAGTSMANVLRTNVYLKDRYDFAEMNAVYAEFFPNEPPARTTVEAHPPVNIRVEIDCIAALPE